jgi:hypothetical protein
MYFQKVRFFVGCEIRRTEVLCPRKAEVKTPVMAREDLPQDHFLGSFSSEGSKMSSENEEISVNVENVEQERSPDWKICGGRL